MSEAPASQIVVSAVIPPAPLVLLKSEFLAELQATAAKVELVKITDQASANHAAVVLTELTVHANRLEVGRTTLKAPFIAAGKQIDAVAKKSADKIEGYKGRVRAALNGWNEAQRVAAAQAEEKRQAELKRLEDEKRAQEEAAALEAASAVPVSAADEPLDFGFVGDVTPKTEIEKKIEEVKYAPVAAPVKVEGVRFIVCLKAGVTDLSKIPDQFVTREANLQLIRQTYCVGWKDGSAVPALPGVKFTVDRLPVSTGNVGI